MSVKTKFLRGLVNVKNTAKSVDFAKMQQRSNRFFTDIVNPGRDLSANAMQKAAGKNVTLGSKYVVSNPAKSVGSGTVTRMTSLNANPAKSQVVMYDVFRDGRKVPTQIVGVKHGGFGVGGTKIGAMNKGVPTSAYRTNWGGIALTGGALYGLGALASNYFQDPETGEIIEVKQPTHTINQPTIQPVLPEEAEEIPVTIQEPSRPQPITHQPILPESDEVFIPIQQHVEPIQSDLSTIQPNISVGLIELPQMQEEIPFDDNLDISAFNPKTIATILQEYSRGNLDENVEFDFGGYNVAVGDILASLNTSVGMDPNNPNDVNGVIQELIGQ